MKKNIFFDIENPNCKNNSICSIGIVVVENNNIVDEIYSLINPEDRFDIRNSEITGIDCRSIQNSPTLKEFWPKIKYLLENNVIFGHNVKYDLNVLTKALFRYDIKVENFKYIDTCELSKKFINSESFKLEDLALLVGYKYKAHNALEDAKASFKVYEVISKSNNIEEYKVFDADLKTCDNTDSKLEGNINELYGIIKGISYDEIIKENEVELIKDWIRKNEANRMYSVFNKILTQLDKILEDNKIDDYEKITLLSIVQSVNESKIYNDSTLRLQVLKGIIKGIVADNGINEKEINNLQVWLNNNKCLSDIYPYDKVCNIVNKVLEDRILSNNESNELMECFNEILNPYKEISKLDLNNKTYCLTGDFKFGTKNEVNDFLKKYNAIEKSGVSSKTDYLFVGGLGSQAWKFGNAGGKILKAQELQEKGSNIKIVEEKEVLELLNDK